MAKVTAADVEKHRFVPFESPTPIVFPHTTCIPAESILPRAANTSSTGVENP